MKRCAILLGAGLLTGCFSSRTEQPLRVRFADEAGSAHVAVLSVSPWEAAKSELQPKFTLSEDQALQKVLPTTGQTEERILDIASLLLKVATPTSASSAVRETKSATGAETITTTNTTRTDASGDVSAVPDPMFPTGGASALPGAPSGWSSIPDTSAALQYLAATALKQEIALIDRYINDAAVAKDTRNFVVRLQFTTIPAARNMPYDVFTNVSFLPGDLSGPMKPAATDSGSRGCTAPISVIPLLVTDDLEGMLVSRTTDTSRQLGLSLLAMLSGVGLSANGQRTVENLTRQLGKQYNSLFTIGLLSRDTIRVRLGANAVPRPISYELVPRTHTISVLLSLPACFSDRESKATAVARTEFHDAVTGRVLDNRAYTSADGAKLLQRITARYELGANADQFRADFQNLSVLAGAGAWSKFRGAATKLWTDDDPVLQESRIVGLYADLVSAKVFNPFSFSPIPLDTEPVVPTLPDKAQSILVPVGKGNAVVRLEQGRYLAGTKLLATLVVGSRRVSASSVAAISNGSGLEITFPPLQKFEAAPGTTAAIELMPAAMPTMEASSGDGKQPPFRVLDTVGPAPTSALVSGFPVNYANALLVAADAPPEDKPGFTLAIGAESILAAADGTGQVAVIASKTGTPKGDVLLTVKGADLVGALAADGSAMRLANGQLKLTADSWAMLRLANLRVGGRVTIGLTDSAKPTGTPVALEITGKPHKPTGASE